MNSLDKIIFDKVDEWKIENKNFISIQNEVANYQREYDKMMSRYTRYKTHSDITNKK
ncbi:hypothetical protein AAHH67_15765 [Niallia circulans]